MIIYPICSSSKGNCSYISNDNAAILIDAGVSLKTLESSLALAGLSKEKIKAIFITHEHSDHVFGLYNITKKLKVPVFSSKAVLKYLIIKNFICKGTKLYEINIKTPNIMGLIVSAFKVYHDSVDGVRFSVSCGESKISVCTDLGIVDETVFKSLAGSDIVFIESNYDEEMLSKGPYPNILKKRIVSRYGHLSNLEAAKAVSNLINLGVRRFIIGHISRKNNMPQIALKTIISHLMEKGKHYNKDYEIYHAPIKSNGKYYEV